MQAIKTLNNTGDDIKIHYIAIKRIEYNRHLMADFEHFEPDGVQCANCPELYEGRYPST